MTDRYDKLVRDGIPALVRLQGDVPHCRALSNAEHRAALAAKLAEEAAEYRDSGEPEELADLLEVVLALMAAHGLTDHDLETLMAGKRARRGGFHRQTLLETVDRRDPHGPPPRLELRRTGSWMREQWPFLMESWQAPDGRITPWAAGPRGMDFDGWLADVNQLETAYRDGMVPATLYGLVETAPDGTETLVGFLDLRHRLNDSLLKLGGHIGYGLHPAARGRGLAPAMLRLGLAEAAGLGLEKVLLTCDKANLPSAATIRHCGGALENEVVKEDGTLALRFWVHTAR